MVSGPPPRLQGIIIVICFSGKAPSEVAGVSCWESPALSGDVPVVLPPQAAKLRIIASARTSDMSFFIVFSPLFIEF